MQFEPIEVFTHSGFKADERPTAFVWRGRRYAVATVVDRWYEGGMRPGAPTLNYFKVRSDDGGQYMLRYNGLFDAWAIALSDSR